MFRLDSAIRWLDAAEGLLAEGLLAEGSAGHPASRPPADQIWASDASTGNGSWPASATTSPRAWCTRAELDERLTMALSARTGGDLRRLMADLP